LRPAAALVRRAPPIAASMKSKAETLLVAHPAADARPAEMRQVVEPPVAREIDRAVVAMKLSTQATPAPSGFSGAFIRPLGASFTRTGE
jgi:hypothetical protein